MAADSIDSELALQRLNPNAIIEAVPNFSEGRRPEVIKAIIATMARPDVLLLDHSSDWDHNRTVVTLAGPPQAILNALYHAVATAARLINMFHHTGEHPRLGATDIVPLIPIANISLQQCAELARLLGRRIGESLELPVYLYEAAASTNARINLADVRRGEFEQLLNEIDTPPRRPDFGPARVGPAGAVIVGARTFLIAFNFYLSTANLSLAKQIARTIRASNGGFPGVKAMGVLVDGQAQVSMNLVDYTQTPLHVVLDRVTELAAQHDVTIDRTELIGLMPQNAVLDVAAHYLRLPSLQPGQMVENAIADAQRAASARGTG